MAAITFARPHSTPGPMLRDFEAYYAAGMLAAQGENPYTLRIWVAERSVPGVQANRNEVLPFIGPPPYLSLWRAFAFLPYRIAAALWSAILLLAFLATCIVFLCKSRLWSPANLTACVLLCVGFGPFTSGFALGQDALLSTSALWLAVLLYESTLAWSAVALFFSGLQPNVALAFSSQLPGTRALLVAAGGLAMALLAGILFEAPLLRSYVQELLDHGRAERLALIQVTPGAIAYGFGVGETAAGIISIALALVALAVAVRAVRRNSDSLLKLAIVCALLPFAMPFFHEHNFVLLLPAILLGLFAPFRPTLWFGLGAGLCAVDWLGLAQRPDALAQSLLLLVAFALALYCAGGQRVAAAGACALIPIIILVGYIARLHPAPVWPDAMYGAPPLIGSVAKVWHDELARTGQFRSQPLWAALRACTLLGSALLCICFWNAGKPAAAKAESY